VSLPHQFIAAWNRSEAIVDGEVVTDAGRTVWVEAGPVYVDVRGPGGFASDTTFAGTTSWIEPRLTWSHAIDADLESHGVDVGLISYDGEDMIEEGEYVDGRVIKYSERWQRLPGGDGPVLAAVTDGGIAVRVGDHASVVVDARRAGGAIAARYAHWDGIEWKSEIEFGDAAALALLPTPLEPGTEPPEGWSWSDQ
jgi:hypothetical protein